MERRILAVISVLVVLVVVLAAVAAIEYNSKNTGKSTTGTVTLTEKGSTLLLPVFNAWQPNYTGAKIQANGGGSGSGIQGAGVGTVLMGGSDAFLSGSQNAQYKGLMNIPILISYQYVAYNVPGITGHLNLSGNIIAGIFSGTITNWNDAAIQSANPTVTLPNHAIIPVHRSDGSGDTFMFTSFLTKSNSTWAKNVGTGTSVNWPSVSGEQSGNGNSGLIDILKSTQYTITYVAATYTSQVVADGFGVANLLDHNAGEYVAPTVANVSNAASHYLSSIPSNGTIALQYAPGTDSYPIADMEYVMVYPNQTSSANAYALQSFLGWAVSSGGGSNPTTLAQYNLVGLPSTVVQQIVYPLLFKIQAT